MLLKAVCVSCRRDVKVSPDLAGKMVKCPSCGATFRAPALDKHGRQKTEKQSAPSFHLSPGVIVALIAAISCIVIFGLWTIGPKRVNAYLAENEQKWIDNANDVIIDGLRAKGAVDFTAGGGALGGLAGLAALGPPQVHNLAFIHNPLYFTKPTELKFAGLSSQGIIHTGVYTIATGEVQAIAELDGTVTNTGVLVKRGKTTVQITGRNKDGTITLELDGKPAKVDHTPPPPMNR
jgi:hypothetical protein